MTAAAFGPRRPTDRLSAASTENEAAEADRGVPDVQAAEAGTRLIDGQNVHDMFTSKKNVSKCYSKN